MQWTDLIGHERQQEWIRTALANRRLASSFLFVGPEAIGKRTFARLVAKGLLCRATDALSLDACGDCDDCAQVEAGTHPDLLTIAKPAEKSVIPVELLIGERDKRMREGLCHDICMRPYGGRRKIAIIDDADYFNLEGANCLLKTLEEPPPKSLILLMGTSLQRQLPTIRSRCQAVIFRSLEAEQVEQLLLKNGIAESPEQAAALAISCAGSLADAKLLTDGELTEFRETLIGTLGKPPLPLIELAKSCGAIVDAAGKDARAKRERMKLIFRFSAAFYRDVALQLSPQMQDSETGAAAAWASSAAVRACCKNWKTGQRGATLAWNRCLVAAEEVERNANQATLLEAWSSDIARLSGC